MAKDKILILGGGGQIGTELTLALREAYGKPNVFTSDINAGNSILEDGPFEVLDAMDGEAVLASIKRNGITQVYLLAALLSATAEQKPALGWRLNMQSLLSLLEIAVQEKLDRIYWPSSIAAFGPNTPKHNTPQYTVTDPTTVYGITKLAGELWADWYHRKHGVDIRSLRYPGVISHSTPPGGGTTDYAIHIFHKALANGTYESFLSADTALPMIYMEDAIRATLELMHAPAEQVKIRTSYNLAGVTFTPAEIAESIRQHIPGFTITYAPDFRQKIAESWPQSIDDSRARADWGWQHRFGLEEMTADMLMNLRTADQPK